MPASELPYLSMRMGEHYLKEPGRYCGCGLVVQGLYQCTVYLPPPFANNDDLETSHQDLQR